jgi:hypothetical protein
MWCLLGAGILLTIRGSSLAQDFEEPRIFNPIIAPTPTKKPAAAPAVFSFARFEPNFRLLCEELEADGRRERLVAIAVVEADRADQDCISCRALWRTVIGGCAKLGARPTPKVKAQVTSPTTPPGEKEGDVTDSAEENSGGEGVEENQTPTPAIPAATPTSVPKARAPSTAAVDIASRISAAAYAQDPGAGGVYPAFKSLVSTVLSTKDLSVAEREYFDTLTTFLMAAWEGRDDTEGAARATPAVNVDEFFEE